MELILLFLFLDFSKRDFWLDFSKKTMIAEFGRIIFFLSSYPFLRPYEFIL